MSMEVNIWGSEDEGVEIW